MLRSHQKKKMGNFVEDFFETKDKPINVAENTSRTQHEVVAFKEQNDRTRRLF